MMMDNDGYPEDHELNMIAEWPYGNFSGMMKYVRERWNWGRCWTENDDFYQLSTGGWSGNESLIGAMQSNKMFWLMCWQSSRRGGHYEFKLPNSTPQPSACTQSADAAQSPPSTHG